MFIYKTKFARSGDRTRDVHWNSDGRMAIVIKIALGGFYFPFLQINYIIVGSCSPTFGGVYFPFLQINYRIVGSRSPTFLVSIFVCPIFVRVYNVWIKKCSFNENGPYATAWRGGGIYPPPTTSICFN